MALIHTIRASGRTLCTDSRTIVQHGLNSDYVRLELGPAWDGLKVVVFFGDDDDHEALIYDGEPVPVPSRLMLDVGYLPVSVVGYADGGRTRALSASADRLLQVVPSGVYDGNDPVDGGEDLLGQLVGARDDALDAADTADEAAGRASESADRADQAAERASQSADAADAATAAAKDATEDALNAAQAAGERSLYAYADPDADDRIILEYPAFLESDDGGSVYLTLEGSDFNG